MAEFTVLPGNTVAIMNLSVLIKTAEPVCRLVLKVGFNLDNGSISNCRLTEA
ncbi:Uncharacterised protein [Klebsiella pneumoniae]|nr:Uncharacterised protein [Klebsiella pneumoniae]